MPNRPRPHVLADLAVREFAGAIEPSLKLYERPQPEYGVDGDVEEFDPSGAATGLHFFVQVKGTDEEDLGKALALQLPLDTADYYRQASMPVLMVRYHAPSGDLFVRWFHQYDPYDGRGGKKSLTFRWEPEDRWTSDSPQEIAAGARAYYSLRGSSLELPQPLYLVCDESFPQSEAELRLALRTLAAERSDILDLVAGPPAAGALWLEAKGDRLIAHLANVTSANLHLREGPAAYADEDGAANAAADLLVLTAVAFERVSQDKIASRLASTFLTRSSLAGHADTSFALVSAMTRDHRIIEALDLADQLDAPDDAGRSRASFVFTLAAIHTSAALSDGEIDAAEKTLKERIKRRKKGGKVEAGRAAMNLATFMRGIERGSQAVSHYETALKLDPGYQDRAHYWFELGGALWMTRRYDESVAAYEEAILKGSKEPLARALLADAKMFAGRYAEALADFEAFLVSEFATEDDGEYRLKARGLDYLIQRLGLEEQDRNLDEVLEVLRASGNPKTKEEWVEASIQQLSKDALWGSAWLNLGVAARKEERFDEALECDILATILIPDDYETWTNAISDGIALFDGDTVVDLITTGRRLGGTQLIQHLVAAARNEPAAAQTAFLEALDLTLDQIPKRRNGGLTLRVLSEDGTVEEIVMPAEFERGPATPPSHSEDS